MSEGAASDVKLQVRRHKKKFELQTFGVPRRCPGCTVVLAGTGSQSHRAECRTRMEQLMREDVGRGGVDSIPEAAEEVEDRVPALPDTERDV